MPGLKLDRRDSLALDPSPSPQPTEPKNILTAKSEKSGTQGAPCWPTCPGCSQPAPKAPLIPEPQPLRRLGSLGSRLAETERAGHALPVLIGLQGNFRKCPAPAFHRAASGGGRGARGSPCGWLRGAHGGPAGCGWVLRGCGGGERMGRIPGRPEQRSGRLGEADCLSRRGTGLAELHLCGPRVRGVHTLREHPGVETPRF